MTNPLVTVVCLCFNHERFVTEAVESVINQTYNNLQIIIVDDASTDNSVNQIKLLAQKYPKVQTILLTENQGNCKAFNLAFQQAKGKYIIDFATDDVMLKNRISEQVSFFEKQTEQVGVIFSNAINIDEQGNDLNLHTATNVLIPQGDVFSDVLARYFICPPTMMVKKEVLDKLNGYDESLAYEDFDFWIRSARDYHYAYQNQIITKRRIVKTSHSKSFVKFEKMTDSTRIVCEKAYYLCNSEVEFEALQKRINHEILFAFRQKHWNVVVNYSFLVKKLNRSKLRNQFIIFSAKLFSILK